MDVAKQQEVHGLHAFSPRMNLTAAEQVRAEDSLTLQNAYYLSQCSRPAVNPARARGHRGRGKPCLSRATTSPQPPA